MKRHYRHLVIAGVLCLGVVPAVSIAAKPPVKAPVPVPPPEPATVPSLAEQLEQFKWGSNHADVGKEYTQAGGLFDQDYNPMLAKMQPGVGMQAAESERESKKVAVLSTFVEFKDTPTGYDRAGIREEYTYRNHESLMYADRAGKRRYFFFIGAPPAERLWKIYDEVPLKEGGLLGKSFQEAVTKMQVLLNVPGRLRLPDPAQNLGNATVDWQDGATHLRVIDRSAESPPAVGVIVEDRATLGALASLRMNKEEDPLALDPSIATVTRGLGRQDPNAAKPASSAAGKGPKPKK